MTSFLYKDVSYLVILFNIKLLAWSFLRFLAWVSNLPGKGETRLKILVGVNCFVEGSDWRNIDLSEGLTNEGVLEHILVEVRVG